ncbi:MAG: transcriptional regulator [Candidatus Marsarchaeota archaeon]|nr:transcriptional regulator [Candidatus Marsarchaeota archaeon]
MMGIAVNGSNDLPYSLEKKYRRLLLYARISTLAMLDYYGKDGLSYQDIKGALNLEDGSLAPNLLWLKNNHYIKSEEVKVENKQITAYYIEEKGSKAYKEIKSWLNNILHLQD